MLVLYNVEYPIVLLPRIFWKQSRVPSTLIYSGSNLGNLFPTSSKISIECKPGQGCGGWVPTICMASPREIELMS